MNELNFFDVHYERFGEHRKAETEDQPAETEADFRANMWISLIENRLISQEFGRIFTHTRISSLLMLT
jgi:hypothetical protein